MHHTLQTGTKVIVIDYQNIAMKKYQTNLMKLQKDIIQTLAKIYIVTSYHHY